MNPSPETAAAGGAAEISEGGPRRLPFSFARRSGIFLRPAEKPGELPVLSVDQYAYVVNMTTARKLNIFPSVEILQIAETVE